MKKIILFTIFGIIQNIFSQEIEKMDKKELRIAYQNQIISKNNQKDSLINIINELTISNTKLLDEVNKNQQLVLFEKTKNEENRNKIIALQQEIKSQEERIKVLSVKPINLTAFSEIPEELAGCSLLLSINKDNFIKNKFLYFDDLGTNGIISIDGTTHFLKKSSSFHEGDDEIIIYSNDYYSAYVHLKKYLGDSSEESQIYSAELVVKDKNNQEVKIKVYGEGGC